VAQHSQGTLGVLYGTLGTPGYSAVLTALEEVLGPVERLLREELRLPPAALHVPRHLRERVLQGTTGYYRVLQGTTGYYRVLQGTTGYYPPAALHVPRHVGVSKRTHAHKTAQTRSPKLKAFGSQWRRWRFHGRAALRCADGSTR
jgi:hypothetical protein